MKNERNSGLGEFWDNWLEESEKEQAHIKELIEERKQEAKERLQRIQEEKDG